MEKGPAPLVVLFVLAVVTVDFAIQRTCFQDVWHENVRGAFIGFCLAQVALLTLWMVAGSGHGLPRMMIGLTATLLLARLLASLTRDTRPNEWFGTLCLFGFALATPLWILHRQGICLVRGRVSFLNDRTRFWEREGEAPAEPQAQRELRPPVRELRAPIVALGHLEQRVGMCAGPWQFSLQTAFVWTTGYCVVLGVMRGVGFPWDFAQQVIVHCLGFAIVALASLWLVFGSRGSLTPVMIVAITSPLLGWIMGLMGSQSQLVAVVCASEMLVAACGGGVLRMSGFSLQRGVKAESSNRLSKARLLLTPFLAGGNGLNEEDEQDCDVP